MKQTPVSIHWQWCRHSLIALCLALLALTGCADNLVAPANPPMVGTRQAAWQPLVTPTVARATSVATAQPAAEATMSAVTTASATPVSLTQPTLPPPPIIVPPTPAPPAIGRPIALDTVIGLRTVRQVGTGQAVHAVVAPRDQILVVATTAGLSWFEVPSLRPLRFDAVAGGVLDVLFSPDGQLAVSIPATPRQSGGNIEVRRVSDGTLLTRLSGTLPTFSPDTDILATMQAVEDRLKTQLWQSRTGEALAELEGGSPVFHPSGDLVATVQGQNTSQPATLLWQSADGTLVLDLPGARPAFSPDGRLLATVTNREIQLWSMPDGKPAGRLRPDHSTYTQPQLAFSADSQLLHVLTDTELHVWNVGTGMLLSRFTTAASGRSLLDSRFNRSSTVLTTFYSGDAGMPRGVRMLRTNDGSVIYNDDQSVRGSVSDTGYLAALVNQSGQVEVVDLVSSTMATLTMPEFRRLALSPDGRTLATARNGTLVDLWQVDDMAFMGQLGQAREPPRVPRTIRFAPDGQTLIIDEQLEAGEASPMVISVWPVQVGSVGTEVLNVAAVNGRMSAGAWAFHPPRSAMAWVDRSGRVQLRSANGAVLTVTEDGSANAVAFNANGSLLAVGDQAGNVQLLRTEGGYIYDTLQAGAAVTRMTFSPDGSLLAVVRADGLLLVWRVDEQNPLVRVATDTTLDVFMLTPNNQLLVLSSPTGVFFHRLSDGQLVHRLDVVARDVSLDASGRLLAVLHDNQRATLWSVP